MANEPRLTNKEAKKLAKELQIRKYTENPMALAEFADECYYEMLARLRNNMDCLDLETTAAIMTQIGNFSNKRRELIVKYMNRYSIVTIIILICIIIFGVAYILKKRKNRN